MPFPSSPTSSRVVSFNAFGSTSFPLKKDKKLQTTSNTCVFNQGVNSYSLEFSQRNVFRQIYHAKMNQTADQPLAATE